MKKTFSPGKLKAIDASEEFARVMTMEMEVMKIIGRHINIINLLGSCTQNGKFGFLLYYRTLSIFSMSTVSEIKS